MMKGRYQLRAASSRLVHRRYVTLGRSSEHPGSLAASWSVLLCGYTPHGMMRTQSIERLGHPCDMQVDVAGKKYFLEANPHGTAHVENTCDRGEEGLAA